MLLIKHGCLKIITIILHQHYILHQNFDKFLDFVMIKTLSRLLTEQAEEKHNMRVC